jgi:hypothetical protein
MKILEILENTELYKKITTSSLEYVKTLDNWEKKVDEFQNIIKQTLKK